MSIWKRAMDYLGLGPDDAYDEYDDMHDDRTGRQRAPIDDRVRTRTAPEYDDTGVRPVPQRPSFPIGNDGAGRRYPSDDSGITPRPIATQPRQPSNVRPAGAQPQVFRPRSFEAVQELAGRFKDGFPVVLSLEAADRDVARRLLDFCYGVCYALGGTMEKRATGVYLLKPAPSRSADAPEYDD